MNLAILREPVIRIPTPEQVYLEYPLAGFGRRALAALIDHAIIGACEFILVFIFMFLGIALGAFSASYESSALEGWFIAFFIALFAVIILVPLFYFIVFEYYWKGQTPGKKVANIQVMRASGLALDRTSAILRNLFRIVDWLPSSYFIGIWSMMLTGQQRRLGDMVAGTITVALPRKHGKREVDAGTRSLGAAGAGQALFSGSRDEELLWLVNAYMHRRQHIEPQARGRIARGLAERAGLDPNAEFSVLEQQLYRRITNQ